MIKRFLQKRINKVIEETKKKTELIKLIVN